MITDLLFSSAQVPLERYLVPFLRICEWHLKPTHSLNSPLRAKWLARRGRPQKRAPLRNLTRQTQKNRFPTVASSVGGSAQWNHP